MVALLRRNLGQIAPRGPVSIDWGHPLAQGLMRYASFTASRNRSPVDLVAGDQWTPTGPHLGELFAGQRLGGAVETTALHGGDQTYWVVPGAVSPLSGLVSWTMAVYAVSLDDSLGMTLYNVQNGTPLVVWDAMSGGSTGRLWYRDDGGTLASLTGTINVADLRPHLYVATRIGATLTAYVDGRLDVSGGSLSGAALTTLNGGQLMGSTSGTGSGKYAVAFAGFWRRGFSQSDVLRLQAEPYAFLTQAAAVRTTFGYSAVAAGDPVMAAPLGALSASMTATVESQVEAVFAAPLGTLTATANAVVNPPATTRPRLVRQGRHYYWINH